MKKTITLKKNYEFKRVLTKGKYYSGRQIECFVIKTNSPKNHLGIAIGVKIAKAVKRNRIKRLIRENYRLLEDELQTGYYFIFLWKKKVDVSCATFLDIKADMLHICKEMGSLTCEK